MAARVYFAWCEFSGAKCCVWEHLPPPQSCSTLALEEPDLDDDLECDDDDLECD